MADSKVSALPTVTPAGSDFVYLVQPGNSRKATAQSIAALAPVQSVAGRTGAVTLAKADVGLSNVDNTSDSAKPVSTATQAALDLKASAAYVYQQSTPAAIWTINHNLGYRPSVELLDSGSQEIDGEVSHPTVNQTLVTLSPASAGLARLT